jgi:hypothetical protein
VTTANHCPSCTCEPGTTVYCESEVTIRHETFGCLEIAGHVGSHKGSILPAPCENCGGYEEHTKACPTPELTAPFTDISTGELIWSGDGTILTEGVSA